eukprot:TRINITY_DN208_c0_g2_i1.p1 TRINITY_DN208_c0_g2~~TRINITY_DN208_c0_g2_i1.p1  ORF type:complete len:536 (-),score=158.63 TRINITY_DN208_c0_g2_i1:46-1653(-)
MVKAEKAGFTEEKPGDVDKKFYTLSDIAKHNTPEDCWVAVHGKVYDLTDFIPKHPGGDVIGITSGKEATVFFETYHLRPVSVDIIKQYQVGTLQGPKGSAEDTEGYHDSFYSWNSPFYKTLKQRVVARLQELKKPRRGTTEIKVKAVLILMNFWGALAGMYVIENFFLACLCAIWMGVSASFVGTCIQHDGNHGAFSTWSRLNRIAGWTLDMIGASAFTWQAQHNLGHHPYTNVMDVEGENAKEHPAEWQAVDTNVQESDPDVFSNFPFMRMHPSHKREWYHKYQHMYAPFLFSFMTLSKAYMQDFEMISNQRLYHIDAGFCYKSAFNVARFWIMKFSTLMYMLVLPCLYRRSFDGVILFFIGHMVCGQFLASFFIVNHIIEGASFAKRERDADGKVVVSKPATPEGITPMEATNGKNKHEPVPLNDWAAVQCQTSVNYSAGSWFMNHFSGGLSHQIEHHLFPGLCHTNYCYVQDIVENTCKEFGVPYQNEKTIGHAYVKMISFLKTLGQQDHPYWFEEAKEGKPLASSMNCKRD